MNEVNHDEAKPTIYSTDGRELNEAERISLDLVKQFKEATVGFFNSVTQASEADPRWAAIARTHFQEGFMALTRAITKPTTF